VVVLVAVAATLVAIEVLPAAWRLTGAAATAASIGAAIRE